MFLGLDWHFLPEKRVRSLPAEPGFMQGRLEPRLVGAAAKDGVFNDLLRRGGNKLSDRLMIRLVGAIEFQQFLVFLKQILLA